MKIKEQNAYLAAAGFVQLLFMATAGAGASEMFTSNRNPYLMVTAICVATLTGIAVVAIYAKVFLNAKNRKK